MPETDVNKMKVADLKRELKIRGLATNGNKIELQDRLQSALIDGELLLDDTAISGEDLLDEDAVLTDEEEQSHILGDENELLESPIIKDSVASPSLVSSLKKSVKTEVESPLSTARKFVLKRKSSFTTHAVSVGAPIKAAKTNEDGEPSTTKLVKINERKPISVGNDVIPQKILSAATAKIWQLSLEERLRLRAKKFGTPVTSTAVKTAIATNNKINAAPIVDDKQIQILQKRAERFGCAVAPQIVCIDAESKKLKRKERFGGGNVEKTGEWSDKALLRLERFKAASKIEAKVGVVAPDLTKSEN